VQDEIASAVVLELKVALLGAPLKARETDPRSYVLFLQARDLARQGTSDSQKQAIDLYQKAVDVDPTHVAAWVGLANTHWLEVYGGGRTPDEGIRLAREAIQKALALDSGYAQAHALLGAIAITYDLDYLAAVQHIDRALALAPSNPDVIGIAGLLARRLGRHDQAIALFEYQVSQDPLNWAGHDDLAYANRYAGHLDKAIAEHRMELSLSPTINGPHSQIAEVLLQKGDTDAAIAELTLEPDEQFRLPVLSMARHAQRMEPESDAALAELIRKYHRTSAASIAMVFAFRSANDRAFEWLDKAKQQHDLALGSIAAYPMYANLHSDPRWLPFLRKLGMAPEQLAAIKFDVTVPR
jgi:tetratricopeptide (TPR) repeat protein